MDLISFPHSKFILSIDKRDNTAKIVIVSSSQYQPQYLMTTTWYQNSASNCTASDCSSSIPDTIKNVQCHSLHCCASNAPSLHIYSYLPPSHQYCANNLPCESENTKESHRCIQFPHLITEANELIASNSGGTGKPVGFKDLRTKCLIATFLLLQSNPRNRPTIRLLDSHILIFRRRRHQLLEKFIE